MRSRTKDKTGSRGNQDEGLVQKGKDKNRQLGNLESVEAFDRYEEGRGVQCEAREGARE